MLTWRDLPWLRILTFVLGIGSIGLALHWLEVHQRPEPACVCPP